MSHFNVCNGEKLFDFLCKIHWFYNSGADKVTTIELNKFCSINNKSCLSKHDKLFSNLERLIGERTQNK